MNQAVEKDIKAFSQKNPLFEQETIALEKNENSGLIRKVKPCSEEFFERLFEEVFWKTYSDFGLARTPFDCRYVGFIGGEMFFCKNTAERFLKNIGTEKKFRYSNGKIEEYLPINISNILFTLAAPFEMARNASRLSVAALKVNAETQGFEEHYNKSLKFWRKNRKIKDSVNVSKKAMSGALESMRYSIISSLAYSFKINLRESFPTKNNFLKELIEKANRSKKTELIEKNGYFSLSPYDISKPYLEENSSIVEFLKKVPEPREPHFIWRENSKLCCSMYLSVLRKCFQSIGGVSGLGETIFFLKPSELEMAFHQQGKAHQLCLKRKKKFNKYTGFVLPPKIAVKEQKGYFEKKQTTGSISGFSVGSKNSASGQLVFVENSSDFGKVSQGNIVFSKNLSPELVAVYWKCSAIISECGGMLSHGAIVARERGMPCIVQVKGSEQLREGTIVEVNGKTGKITLL